MMILAAHVGPNGDRVVSYAEACTSGGQKLVDAMAIAIRDPATLERLQIDLDQPSALLVTAAGDARFFGLPGPGARFAILDGDVFFDLIATLNEIPPRYAGRPSTKVRKWN
jgi:hypothetical protein